jgi:hypothetical protein
MSVEHGRITYRPIDCADRVSKLAIGKNDSSAGSKDSRLPAEFFHPPLNSQLFSAFHSALCILHSAFLHAPPNSRTLLLAFLAYFGLPDFHLAVVNLFARMSL